MTEIKGDWVLTKDPNGNDLWVNKVTMITSYSPPMLTLDDAAEVISCLQKKVEALESKAKWIRFTGNKSTVFSSGGLTINSIAKNIASIHFNPPREDTTYTVLANVCSSKYYKTWARVGNISKIGFDVLLLTEAGEIVTIDDRPDIEISCVVMD